MGPETLGVKTIHKILYRESWGNSSISYTINGGELTESEKKDGKRFHDRVIDAAECGSRIAARRIKNEKGVMVITGEILPELLEVIRDKNPTYWGCLMAQQIHKWVAPRHVIVDYRALREREEAGGSL